MSSDQLKLATLCAYLTDISNPWRDADWAASKMVKALKGDPINGYFEHVVGGKKVRFDQSNIGTFLDRIPPAMSRLIARQLSGAAATLVPIPNSHVTTPESENFRTLELARKIAALSGGSLTVSPALVFSEPQIKSREGGSRSAAHFEKVYRITQNIAGPIVLVDDVCTTGAHFIGACWKLTGVNREIVLASAFGRSTKAQINTPVGVREEILDIRRPPANLAELVKRLLG